MTTVFKAAQALSKEVVLDRLLETLMRVVLEAAGAQQGVLLLQQDGELIVRAHGQDHLNFTDTQTIVEEVPLKHFDRAPTSVINYVRRTQETVVIADAMRDGIFGRDPHFHKVHTRSALCLPIIKQSKLLGILYLENNLAPHVFTPASIDLLQLLSGQIITSLENVMLFEALRSSETQFRLTFEMAAVGEIQVDCATGRFVRVNAKFCETTGYSESELLNLSYFELTNPDDKTLAVALFAKFASGELSEEELTIRFVRKDGKTISVQLNLAVICDSSGHPVTMVGVVQDITDRLQADQELRRGEELFRWMVLEVADYSIVMLDKQGHVLTWNTGAERISGYDVAEITGRHFSDFYAEDALLTFPPQQQLQVAAQTGRFEGTHLQVRKDGEQFWVSTVITALNDATGDLKGFTLLTRDLTEQVKSSEERKQLAVLREREDFMAALTHDLKNPLIGGNRILELFVEGSIGTLNDTQLSIIRKLRDSNHSLILMLTNLTDVYRMQRDVNSLRIQSIDIVGLIRDCCHDIEPICTARTIKLKTRLTNVGQIEADLSFTRRVVQNLLDNALKFTPAGGSIDVQLNKVIDHERIELHISDTGPGLSKGDRERLFEKFWQGVAGKRYVPGTGLGLHLCKQVIDGHGGTIDCISEIGKGTTMIVTLPVLHSKLQQHKGSE